MKAASPTLGQAALKSSATHFFPKRKLGRSPVVLPDPHGTLRAAIEELPHQIIGSLLSTYALRLGLFLILGMGCTVPLDARPSLDYIALYRS